MKKTVKKSKFSWSSEMGFPDRDKESEKKSAVESLKEKKSK